MTSQRFQKETQAQRPKPWLVRIAQNQQIDRQLQDFVAMRKPFEITIGEAVQERSSGNVVQRCTFQF